MKAIIKRFVKNVLDIVDRIKWRKQYKTIVSGARKTNYILNSEWYKGCKILLLVPHADDELISSYTVLCNADDITVYYCGFTGSNKSEENGIRRREELLKLCSILNIRVIEGEKKCDNLKAVLDEGKYDVILLPSIVDWHNEHRRISYMVNNVCVRLKIAPEIYCYSVTVPNESPREVLCVPLTEEQLQRKYEIFKKIYLSQKVMPIVRLKLNEKINGFHANVYSAETFLKQDFYKWSNMVSRLELQDNIENSTLRTLASALYNNLNNLVEVRQTSKRFYSWLETKDEMV